MNGSNGAYPKTDYTTYFTTNNIRDMMISQGVDTGNDDSNMVD